ncbi:MULTISPECIES: biotin synthase BioB [unclassified Pseudodesulfovibrio]|uniref:biotin synthase BioB n=1 Tax=unclassified Pseudodesulfovibrio TaxID=2661612 RepID=UPI000FEBC923|nr:MULTISPECIES: biotin synthase BioB [unclassified Pseudodesulfovibrio]MCJ2166049.1 biotin synthase BioB [Pseudodesulfovibrio sp. S3-i]RWU02494.1 biotin synthase BioB [Pseudodesulfovibrio sp. S3]
MSLKIAQQKILAGKRLSDSDIHYILELPAERLGELLECAHTIRKTHFGGQVSLCAIVNAKSGTCSENCSFCAQSGFHKTDSPEYPLLPAEEIAAAGAAARKHGVTRFGVVASGKRVGEADLLGFARGIKLLADMGLSPDISPGILDRPQLVALKKSGLQGYHHNLETSASFFPKMCTTHTYDEDVRAVRAGLDAGLYVCSGGIFGIGESWDDRVELALLLAELGVPSVPMNFLHPIPGTPLQDQPILKPEEALKIVALYRFLLPDRALRICGGRLTVFGKARKAELLKAGTSGLMVGNYLTTKGGDAASDLTDISTAGLVVSS